jgi:hypothetical protein
MLGGIIVIVITSLLGFIIIDNVRKKHPLINARTLQGVLFYHILLSFAYYGYIIFNGSDSVAYYQKVYYGFRGDSWLDFYGTSTTFIEFIGYPFIHYLAFSYEATMALFSFFGYLGFVYFYIFFNENIRYKHTCLGLNLVPLIFFLPNLHFWSSSFGKGSVIFLGLALFFYGISKLQKRLIAVAIGSVIIYHVRPHIMLIVLVSSTIGFVFSSRGVSTAWRVMFLAAASVAFFFIYQDVLTLIGIDEDQFITQGLDLTHRATELSKATSGIDIANYSLPEQLFAFLYRPLFFDAPGVLGIIVSFENVFYLLITLRLFTTWSGVKYLFRGNALTKSAFISFFTVSIALAQISGNLGLAMRQKSQVMILFLFVIVSFLDEQRYLKTRALRLKRQRTARLQQQLQTSVTNG